MTTPDASDPADSRVAPRERLRRHRREVTVAVARSLVAIVGLLVVYALAPLSAASSAVPLRSTGAVILLFLVVTAQTVAVSRSTTPALRAVEALAVSVTMLLVTFAAIYMWISARDEQAFTETLEHIDALYLSMMTMTTVGFGDIGALSSGARVAVMAQLVVNVIVLGIAVRIVLRRARNSPAANGVD